MKRLRQSKSLKRNSPLKKRGEKAKKWAETRNKFAQEALNENNLIACEDYKIGLPRCGYAREPKYMDLHHIKGRNERPDLYYDRSNLVFLTRECHERAHNH